MGVFSILRYTINSCDSKTLVSIFYTQSFNSTIFYKPLNPIIIIPAFNPPDSFIELLRSIQRITSIPIIIMDDGSDIKIDIIGYNIIRNDMNRGKGFTLKKGFQYALSSGYTHAITIDADFQHDPKLIQK